jgi:hypothetical protein
MSVLALVGPSEDVRLESAKWAKADINQMFGRADRAAWLWGETEEFSGLWLSRLAALSTSSPAF